MENVINGISVLNSKCHTCRQCQAMWCMAKQSSSAVGIDQFCYTRIIIIYRKIKAKGKILSIYS